MATPTTLWTVVHTKALYCLHFLTFEMHKLQSLQYFGRWCARKCCIICILGMFAMQKIQPLQHFRRLCARKCCGVCMLDTFQISPKTQLSYMLAVSFTKVQYPYDRRLRWSMPSKIANSPCMLGHTLVKCNSPHTHFSPRQMYLAIQQIKFTWCTLSTGPYKRPIKGNKVDAP